MLANDRGWLGLNTRRWLPFARVRPRAGRDFRYATAGKARRLANGYRYRNQWTEEVSRLIGRADDDALGTFLAGATALAGECVEPSPGLLLSLDEFEGAALQEYARKRDWLVRIRSAMMWCAVFAAVIGLVALLLIGPYLSPWAHFFPFTCALSLGACSAFSAFAYWRFITTGHSGSAERRCVFALAGGLAMGAFSLVLPFAAMFSLFLGWRAVQDVEDEMSFCQCRPVPDRAGGLTDE